MGKSQLLAHSSYTVVWWVIRAYNNCCFTALSQNVTAGVEWPFSLDKVNLRCYLLALEALESLLLLLFYQ